MNKPVSKDGFDPDQPEETLIRLKVMEDFKLTTYEVGSMPPCIKGLRTERGFTYMVYLFSSSPFLQLEEPAAMVRWIREDGKEPMVGRVIRIKPPYPHRVILDAKAYFKTTETCTNFDTSESLQYEGTLTEGVNLIVEKSARYLEEKFLSELNILDESVNWPGD
jgi:hypothetical protein